MEGILAVVCVRRVVVAEHLPLVVRHLLLDLLLGGRGVLVVLNLLILHQRLTISIVVHRNSFFHFRPKNTFGRPKKPKGSAEHYCSGNIHL